METDLVAVFIGERPFPVEEYMKGVTSPFTRFSKTFFKSFQEGFIKFLRGFGVL